MTYPLILAIGTVAGWAWVWLALRRPLAAYLTILVIWVLAYPRLGLPLIEVDGPGNRGNVVLGDMLWFSYVAIWVGRAVITGRLWRPSFAFAGPVWVMMPFIGLATLLPLAGVSTGDWPLSYGIPGIRQLQWVSFAFIAAALGRHYGAAQCLDGILNVLCVAGVLHGLYGLVQLGHFLGVFGRIWVVLDDLYAAQHSLSWFYYPRTTGWLVDPNAYGVFCALLMVLAITMYLTGRVREWRCRWWLILGAAGFGLTFSASRTALLGLAGAVWVLMVLVFFQRRTAMRLVAGMAVAAIAGCVALALLWPVLPLPLQERFTNFAGVFSQGVQADRNALARTLEWQHLWRIYEADYPWGTWIPASYATGSYVDSFYVFTAVQGTPVLTLSWLLCLAAVISVGWMAYGRARSRLEMTFGLALAAWAAMLAASALTLSPMLMPHVIAPFWSVAGVLATTKDRESTLVEAEYAISP